MRRVNMPGLLSEIRAWPWPSRDDPRWPFALLLTLYCVLGFAAFGFNRSPWQMLAIVGAGCALDVVLTRVVRGR